MLPLVHNKMKTSHASQLRNYFILMNAIAKILHYVFGFIQPLQAPSQGCEFNPFIYAWYGVCELVIYCIYDWIDAKHI